MMRFLRYNSRHQLYWKLSGDGATKLPRLNPICSGGRGRIIRKYEPIWLFQLRQRWFAFAGKQRCPDRGGMSLVFKYHTDEALPDTWDLGPDGNRTCSYCGSIHFDDLMALCAKVPDDDSYGVEGTTKSYKVYVKQPGVRNASEGAIKFYMAHAPEKPTDEQNRLYSEARRLTHERMMRRWDNMRATAEVR